MRCLLFGLGGRFRSDLQDSTSGAGKTFWRAGGTSDRDTWISARCAAVGCL